MPKPKRNKGTTLNLNEFVGEPKSDLPTGPSGRPDDGPWGRNNPREPREERRSVADDSNQWRRGNSGGFVSRDEGFGRPRNTGWQPPVDNSQRGGDTWRRNNGPPIQANKNRFDLGPDTDDRPAHLKNRFKKPVNLAEKTVSHNPFMDGPSVEPKPQAQVRAAKDRNAQFERRQTTKKVPRAVELSEELQKVQLVTADKYFTMLETAVTDRLSVDDTGLLDSLQRLDFEKTPLDAASRTLANSLFDKKFTPQQMLAAFRTTGPTADGRQLLIGICRAISAKGAVAVQLCKKREEDLTELVALVRGEESKEAFTKLVNEADIQFLQDSGSSESKSELTALLASGASAGEVLLFLEKQQNRSSLRPIIVASILQRVFESKTMSLDVVDSFSAVLASCQEVENVAHEADFLFDAQRVWFHAGAVKANCLPLFKKLAECKIVSYDGLCAWRDDRTRGKSQKKSVMLLSVNNWITEIAPPPEEDDEEEEDEQEDDEM